MLSTSGVTNGSACDRVEPESVEESKEPKDQETTVTMVKPRVGNEIDGVAWIGGSKLDAEKLTEPENTLCFHPTSFKEKQKQHESLKSGLPEAHELELLGGNKTWFDNVGHFDDDDARAEGDGCRVPHFA